VDIRTVKARRGAPFSALKKSGSIEALMWQARFLKALPDFPL